MATPGAHNLVGADLKVGPYYLKFGPYLIKVGPYLKVGLYLLFVLAMAGYPAIAQTP